MTPRLTVIHLARKPLVGTVAANALKYGTGGLNIDGCRLGGGSTERPQNPQTNGGCMNPGTWKGGTTGSVLGRWPANVILQHLPECRLVGHHYEDFLVNVYADDSNFDGYKELFDDPPEEGFTSEVHGQMVEDWDCVEGCPCLDLNQQSGVTSGRGGSTSGKSAFGQNSGWNQHNNRPTTIQRQNDEGGASRYFKQVQSMEELREYLRLLISPPSGMLLPVPVAFSSWTEGLENSDRNTYTGLILYGWTPTDEQMAHIIGTLVPGGHVCLFAPDEQPTGHTGAIRLEDAGFEIRDAILWVRGPERLHYVAKAARKEREAGCQHLPAKKGHEAVERQEGSAGVNNPRAGAGRTAKKVHNHHPTVKPIELMARLLSDVPKTGPVVDPFLGSGTTALGCLRTGHDAIGIEREEEYLRIADARVRHWDRAHQGWIGAEIQSDLTQPAREAERPETVLDIFD